MVAMKKGAKVSSRFVVEGEVVAPRTRDQRYRIYRVKDGGRPDLTATCRTQGEIGTIICRQGAEGMFDDYAIGVMDGRDHKDEKGNWVGKWLVRPWVSGGPSRKEMRAAALKKGDR